VVSSLNRVTARETREVRSFRVSSALRASPEAVWARAATIEGVNAELAPFARMTSPGEGGIRAGALGRSWILLGGVLPVDYDDLCLEAVETGRGFRERSRLGSCSAWHHDRTLHPLPGGGTRVVDEVAFAPRLPAAGGLQAFVFEAAFRWRHRRLRGIWGTP
jgi:ligand-binding SRPBCC domain-containing protein